MLRAVFGKWALITMAVLAVAICLFPWQPASATHYRGFDPTLLQIEAAPGQIEMDKDQVTVTSRGGTPTMHLVSSENEFAADFDVKIIDDTAKSSWHTVSAKVQAPPAARYFTVLVGAVNSTALFRNIRLQDLDVGTGAPATIFDEKFSSPRSPGWKFGDGSQRIPADGGFALRIAAPTSAEKGAWTAAYGPLAGGGHTYLLDSIMRYEGSTGPFKIAVDWLDKDRHHIAYLPDWKDWTSYIQPTVPFGLRVWYPADTTSIDLRFVPDSSRSIIAGTQKSGSYVTNTVLGTYELGLPYHVHVQAVPATMVHIDVTSARTGPSAFVESRSATLDLFSQPYLNLSISAAGLPISPTTAEVSNFDLAIPARTALAAKAADPRLGFVISLVLLWFLVYLIVNYSRRFASAIRRAGSATLQLRPPHYSWWLKCLAWTAGALAMLAVLFLAAQLDGHPYDRLSQETWMYITDQYGLNAIYDRTNAAPDSLVRGGHAPWSSLGFAYMPILAYPYFLIGKAWHAMNSAFVPMQTAAFYTFWKVALSLFVLVEGMLVFYILARGQRVRMTVALLAGALVALNPAVIFDSAVWGETDALLTCVLLLTVLGFIQKRPTVTWSAIVVALLLKQTALFFVPILAVASIKRFGILASVEGLAFGCLVGLAAIFPLVAAGYGPSVVYAPAAAQFGFFASAPSNLASGDTFSLWTLFNGLQGLHGFDRILMPHAVHLPVDASFSLAGLVIWAYVVALTTVRVLTIGDSRRLISTVVWGLALIVVVYVITSPKASARYLLLALPFLLIGAKPLSVTRLTLVTALTVVSLLSMYGLFMATAVRGEWTTFAGLGVPWKSQLANAVYSTYTSDSVMTGLALVLILVAAYMAIITWSAPVGQRPERRAPNLHVLQMRSRAADVPGE